MLATNWKPASVRLKRANSASEATKATSATVSATRRTASSRPRGTNKIRKKPASGMKSTASRRFIAGLP
jgi:hypothetical protein